MCLLAILILALGGQGLRTASADDIGSIRRLFRRGEDASSRAAALRRVAGNEARDAADLLLEGLEDPAPYVRRAAAALLGLFVGDATRKRVLSRLKRAPAVARAAACHTFALWAGDAGREALVGYLRAREAEVRRAAVRSLSAYCEADLEQFALEGQPAGGMAALYAPVIALLEDRDALVRAEALWVLAHSLWAAPKGKRREALPHGFEVHARRLLTREQWLDRIHDPDPRVRVAALQSSAALSSETAMVAVLHGLDDAVWSVRWTAAELSGRHASKEMVERLIPLLDDDRRRVIDRAHAALVEMTGAYLGSDVEAWRAWLAAEGDRFDPEDVRAARRRRPKEGDTVESTSFLDLPVYSRNVVFVLDASASMGEVGAQGRTRWARVTEALDAALGALLGGRERARVNVVRFHDEAEAFHDDLVALGGAQRSRIRRWMEARGPSGRTALYDGIELALRDPEVDTVVVLTDGAPSAGAWFTKTDLLQAVEDRLRFHPCRIDVVGIGSERVSSRWRDVLERLADLSGGKLVRR